jgi:hypothetical protein
MKGEIVTDKHDKLFLQVEGGGSWSLGSIDNALSDLRFFDKEEELADLLYAAGYKMKRGETGPVSSEDADDVDPDFVIEPLD